MKTKLLKSNFHTTEQLSINNSQKFKTRVLLYYSPAQGLFLAEHYNKRGYVLSVVVTNMKKAISRSVPPRV